MKATDLSKRQALDPDPKALQQINFTGNLDRGRSSTIFFIIEKAKKMFWVFRKEPWEYYYNFVLLYYYIKNKTQYNTLNIKLSNSHLNKLKSVIKNGTEVAIKFSSNVVVDFNDETNFRHKLLLTVTQVPRIRKAFANNLLAHMKLSKNQPFGPLLKTGLPLIKNVLKLLAKSVLIPLGLIATSATDASIQKKYFGSCMTKFIISNEEIRDIMKIINL